MNGGNKGVKVVWADEGKVGECDVPEKGEAKKIGAFTIVYCYEKYIKHKFGSFSSSYWKKKLKLSWADQGKRLSDRKRLKDFECFPYKLAFKFWVLRAFKVE